MVKAEIDGILAAEFCSDLLAPVNTVYADEKAGSWEKSDSAESVGAIRNRDYPLKD